VARNERRREALADAGLVVLAREGARGLTHRAVDAQAVVPTGTTSNYFRSREQLVAGLVIRIEQRLQPDPEVLAVLGERTPSVALFGAYVRDIVRRLLADRDATLALFELRLESTRRPDIADPLGRWQRERFAADVAFNAEAGLPGGPREIALFHYALDGLLLDRLTTPIDADTSTEAIIDDLVERLMREAGR
jgi:AcrR family transcriptional regulator